MNTPRTSLLSHWAVPILVVLVAISSLVSLSAGSANISVSDVLSVLLREANLQVTDADTVQRAIIMDIRLPRILMGILVGAALAISGAAMQALFRNPLADPGLIGISGGAAFAAAIVIVLTSRWTPGIAATLGPWGPSIAAFGGGLTVTLLVYRIGSRGGALSVSTMLLAGIAFNALTGAGTGLLTYIAPDQQLRTILFWSLGTLGNSTWQAVSLTAVVSVVGATILIRAGRNLNTLLLGELDATSLGVDLDRVKRMIVLATAMLVGVSVAMCGVIAFVGLVVPHIIRISIGPDNRRLLPCSALLGATLIVSADLLARTVLAPGELPIGIITALVGGPFFLYLLVRNKQGYAI